jgi:hypothetical protein
MVSRIFGLIGMVWGGAVVLQYFMSDSQPTGNSDYQAGQTGALIFAGCMAIVGAYYLFRSSRR